MSHRAGGVFGKVLVAALLLSSVVFTAAEFFPKWTRETTNLFWNWWDTIRIFDSTLVSGQVWIAVSTAVLGLAAAVHFISGRVEAARGTPGFNSARPYRGRLNFLRARRKRLLTLTSFSALGLGWICWAQLSSGPTQVGLFPGLVVHADGSESRYLTFVPHDYQPDSSKRWPVIVHLNGTGENGSDGFSQLSRNVGRPIWEMQREFPFLLVSPQCKEGKSWSGDPEQFAKAMDILDSVSVDYSVDVDRIYLSGVSSGAGAALELAAEYSDRFAAVLAVAPAGPADPEASAKRIAQCGLPVWHFHNVNDENHRKTQSLLNQALWEVGADYCLTSYVRSGHDAWNNAYRDPATYRWLASQTRAAESRAYLPLDSPSATWRGNGSLRVDVDLSRQFELQIKQLGDSGEVLGDLPTLSLKALGPPTKLSGLAKRLNHLVEDQTAGELLGRIALRSEGFNQIEVNRRGAGIDVSANGWLLMQYPRLFDAASAVSVSINLRSDNDSKEFEMIPSVRFPRVYVANDEGLLTVPVTKSPTIPAKIKPRGASTITKEIEAEVKTRLIRRATIDEQVEIRWKISNRFEEAEKPASLSIDSISAKFRTLGRHFRIVTEASQPGTPKQPSLDFLEALSMLQSGSKQQKIWPLTSWHRTVRPRLCRDTWEGTAWTPAITTETKGIWTDDMNRAKVNGLFEQNRQLDWLSAQAAVISIGALDHPVLDTDWDKLKPTGTTELVGQTECVVFLEDTEKDYHRRYWVQAEGTPRIHRLAGSIPSIQRSDSSRGNQRYGLLGDTFIEIQYSGAEPIGWIVVSIQTPTSPIFAMGRSSDVKLSRTALSASALLTPSPTPEKTRSKRGFRKDFAVKNSSETAAPLFSGL